MIYNEKAFKQATKNLNKELTTLGFELSHGATLNLMARTLGFKDYNTIKPILVAEENAKKKVEKERNDELERLHEIKRKNPHSAERGFQPELLNRLCKQREDISYCPCCEKAEHNSEHKAVEQPAFYSVADQEIYSHKRKRPKHRMKKKRTCKIKM